MATASRDAEPQAPVYRHRCGLASGIPLGGLGTGSVELRDDGRFHDWEIFNNYTWSGDPADVPPDLWSEDAFFALRVKAADDGPRVRLLYHDDQESRAVSQYFPYARIYEYAFLRNIDEITYSGRYPFASLAYSDPAVPVSVTLQAFTPFIPFNAHDSGLPLAFFAFHVRNEGATPCEVSLLFSMRNLAGYDQRQLALEHHAAREGALTSVAMGAAGLDPALRTAGTLAVGVLGDGATVLPAWTDGDGRVGFDHAQTPGLSQLFYTFRDTGDLPGGPDDWRRDVVRREISHPAGSLFYPQIQVGWRWRGAVCRKVTLAPGAETDVVFMLGWHFPNHYHYHLNDENLGHMYANWFAGAGEVVRYGAEHYSRLHAESRAFCDALYRGLPVWLAEALNAQLTTFPQSFWWLKNGDLTAWEGTACCQVIPTAHTLWSSFQPLLFFPELYMAMKRKMAQPDAPGFLEVERRHWQREGVSAQETYALWYQQRYEQYYTVEDWRAALMRPRPKRRTAISHEGAAVQVWRDYLWTGDAAFLSEVWPVVKDVLEAEVAQDTDGDGLQDGVISFITYDHWFLPAINCYKATMALAELQAAVAIARRVGDEEAAARFGEILARGAASFERRLWNGEYYNLCYDTVRDAADEGCMAEQVSGHLYLRLCGLPPVHPEPHARAALEAVYRYNRVPEVGLLNGADPRGRTDWRYFARFSMRGDDEARAGQWVTPWTGTEYYVAATMIAEGLVDEGLAVIRDVVERYTAAGMQYNHIECGEHYFRPLDIWASLFALQGLVYDREAGALTVAPRLIPAAHDSILILPGIWGRLTQERVGGRQTNTIEVTSGALPLATLSLAIEGQPRALQATLNGETQPVEWVVHDGTLTARLLTSPTLTAGQTLRLSVAP